MLPGSVRRQFIASPVCRWLGTPKLVRETSRRHWWQRGKAGEKTSEEVRRDFSDIVLPGGLQNHVRALAAVTANTRLHGAPFRHMLFYGPPGAHCSAVLGVKRLHSAGPQGQDQSFQSCPGCPLPGRNVCLQSAVKSASR